MKYFWVPLIPTIGIVAWTIFWDRRWEKAGGLDSLMAVVLDNAFAVVATIVVWLIFFAVVAIFKL